MADSEVGWHDWRDARDKILIFQHELPISQKSFFSGELDHLNEHFKKDTILFEKAMHYLYI